MDRHYRFIELHNVDALPPYNRVIINTAQIVRIENGGSYTVLHMTDKSVVCVTEDFDDVRRMIDW